MYMDIFIWNMIIAHIVVNPYIGHYNSYWWYDHTPVWVHHHHKPAFDHGTGLSEKSFGNDHVQDQWTVIMKNINIASRRSSKSPPKSDPRAPSEPSPPQVNLR